MRANSFPLWSVCPRCTHGAFTPLAVEARRGGARALFECTCGHKWLVAFKWKSTQAWAVKDEESYFRGPFINPQRRISRGLVLQLFEGTDNMVRQVGEWVLLESSEWKCRRLRDGVIEYVRGGLAWYGRGLESDVLWANWKYQRDHA